MKFHHLLAISLSIILPVQAGSILRENEIPALTSSDTTPYELGTRFTTTRAGTITHARVFSTATEGNGFHTVRIWGASTTVPLAGPYYWQYGGENAWLTLDIPDLAIPAGEYLVSISTTTQSPSGGFPYSSGYGSSPDTASTYLKISPGAGLYTTDVGTRPNLLSISNTPTYFRDVVFVIPAEVRVTYGPITIADEDFTPDPAGATDFGDRVIGTYGGVFNYRLENPGSPAITLTGPPFVTLSGAQADQFIVLQQPTNTLLPESDQNGFTLEFRPTSTGRKQVDVTIRHSLAAQGHRFRVAGYGRAPDPNAQQLFQPEIPTAAQQAAAAVDYELGTRFRSGADGVITHLKLYAAPAESGQHLASLWNADTQTRIFGPFAVTNFGPGWNTFNIPDVSILKNTNYLVSITTGTDPGKSYAYQSDFFNDAGTTGLDLEYPEAAGVYTTTLGTMPTLVYQNTNYLRDVVFRIPDTDGDGFNDFEESLYGTSSTDGSASPKLILTPASAGSFALSSPALPSMAIRDYDVNYYLKSSTILTPYSWNFVETNRTGLWNTLLTPTPGVPRLFYRVEAQKVPRIIEF
jgi:Domain of unknown function (DUF4082)